MKQYFLFTVACLLAFNAEAEPEPEPEFLPGVGRLFTSRGRPSACIFPVEVYNIDGRSVNPRSIFTLNAGERTIKARAVVDIGICVNIRRSASRSKLEPITIRIETGKDYYLGLNVEASRRKDWKLEVWKVKGDAFE